METAKRFDFSKMASKMSQMECEDFVNEYKLEDRMREENFLFPELTHMQVLQRALEEDAEAAVIHDDTLASLAQRVIWLVEEVKSLRRTNRNIRSKNLRLKRGRGHLPEAPVPPQRPSVKLLDPTGKQVGEIRLDGTPAVYQPLPDPNAKTIPQNPPRGR